MASLSYKTRDNSSPQGKERVYFTCHPADFKVYFELICEDVFRTQNCAIWYRTNLEEADSGKMVEAAVWSDEELALELGQMQLFVIPVTSRFLYHPNPAREVEFQFAIQHHIPILPLMQEPGMEREFNRICGDLQFLDKQARKKDPTALPYEERLKNFLSSVLLGDDLAAKVRAAFDAYIFLSYRKKDRKYAQELMQLIHRNSFCRDIAIWYDEFLTPGENFNEAILDAMEKSSLFAMVVTPNLVTEVNYVMTTEYPKAADKKMKILPAEMVKTNRRALYDLYPGITEDDITNAYDEKALSEALVNTLSGAIPDEKLNKTRHDAMRERCGDDLQHIFFIGLAYLDGIDVEVNHERAMELINRAAEAGLEEAIKKLVTMYRNGEGIQRNYGMAISWQEKLKRVHERNYEQENTEENGQKYFLTLGELGDFIQETLDIETLRKISERALEIALELHERFGGGKNSHLLCEAYIRMGYVCREEGDLAKARKYNEEALGISEKMAGETGDVKSCHDVLRVCLRLGDIFMKEREIGKASEYYNKYLQMCQELMHKTNTYESVYDLWYACDRLGDICFEIKRYEEALDYFKKGLQISEHILGKLQSVRSLRTQRDSNFRMGYTSEKMGELEKAEEYYQRFRHFGEKVAQKTEMLQDRMCYASSFESLGSVCMRKEDLERAEKFYGEAFHIRIELAKEFDCEENIKCLTFIRQIMGDIYTKQGQLCKSKGDLNKARKYFQEALTFREKIAQEENTEAAKNNLAYAYYFSATADTKSVNCDLLMKALALWEELAAQHPENSGYLKKVEQVRQQWVVNLRFQSGLYEMQGDICKKKEDLAGERRNYEKALNMRKKLAGETGDAQDRCALGSIYDKLGEICIDEGNLVAARNYYEKCLNINEWLANEDGNIQFYLEILVHVLALGNISLAEKNREKAQEYFTTGINVCKKILEKEKKEIIYDYLASFCYRIGKMDISEQNYEMLQQALKIWNHLAMRTPSNPKYRENAREVRNVIANRYERADMYMNLGNEMRAKGDMERAQRNYEMALKIAEELAENTGIDKSRRDVSLACEYLGDVYHMKGDIEKSKEYYERSLHIRERLAEETGTAASRRALSISCDKMGLIYRDKKNITLARKYFMKSFFIRERLAEEMNTPSAFDDLAYSCYYLGMLVRRKPDYEMLKKAVSIWEKITPLSQSSAKNLDLARKILAGR